MPNMIRIWKYADAPQHLKELHPGGSESTWVMEAPAGMSGEVESMIGERPLGWVTRHPLADGSVVFFGQSLAARKFAIGGN